MGAFLSRKHRSALSLLTAAPAGGARRPRSRAPFLLPLGLAAAAAFLPANAAYADPAPLFKDARAPLEKRVDDLFSRLTEAEKISLLTGDGFATAAIPRLGVPEVPFADAGQGVRGGMPGTTGPATLFPAEVTMASTWDPVLTGRIGAAIGEEALNKGPGISIMLGPAVNIHRSPLCGRNGEYFSEDPFLASRLAVGYIEGMQGAGCGACIKHFCCNNEEADRGSVNVRVDERTLREIYLPAFEAGAREAHVWSVMAAYNRINGPHATANRYLLTDVLKKGWGWDGFVMSDWGAVHETAGVINAGCDLEMPGDSYLAAPRVEAAIAAGRVTRQAVDENARRIVRAIVRSGRLDGTLPAPDPSRVNSPAHQKLAYDAACQGIVLLKNQDGLLPLNASAIKSIAVIGPAAKNMQFGAAGSVSVATLYHIEPFDGISSRVGSAATVNYASGLLTGSTVPATAFTTPDGAPGLKAEYFDNELMKGTPQATQTVPNIDFNWPGEPVPGVSHEHFSVRWTGKLHVPQTGLYTFVMTADDGCRVYIDGKEVLAHWVNGSATPISGAVHLFASQQHDIRVEYFQGLGDASANLAWVAPGETRFQDAVAAAARSDVAVVCVNTMGSEAEGRDRESMDLPASQDQLIEEVAAVNKRTVVVLNNGGPVTLEPWIAGVRAVLEAGFPGQEGGHALASILFGDVDPSGKLPDTLAVKREDYPDFGNFPGTRDVVRYAEGIYVGYRHFDKRAIEPVYPFGYGLSYTTFKYSNLRFSSATLSPGGHVDVSVDVSNTGSREGAEVVEVYVHDPAPKIDKPVRELKGFAKIDLQPGETGTATVTLDGRSLAYCDVLGKQWKANAGDYDIEVGASSRDIRLTSTLHLAPDFTEPIPFMADVVQAARDVDLAAGRPATASSVQQEDTPASAAFDGDDDTRWSSDFSDPQWLKVDLGKPATVNGARLSWEAAYASRYKLQTSVDGVRWTDAYTETNGQGGDETVHFKPVIARYVRMLGLQRGTEYGYSIYSFEVYGPASKKPAAPAAR